jgi:hypothetical protein
MTIGQQSSTAKKAWAESFAGLHLLHGQICPHRLGNRVEIFAGFQALLSQKLNLGAAALQRQ